MSGPQLLVFVLVQIAVPAATLWWLGRKDR